MRNRFDDLEEICLRLGSELDFHSIKISSEAILPLYVQLAKIYGFGSEVINTISTVEGRRKNINKREQFKLESHKQMSIPDDEFIIDSLIKEIVLYIRNSNDTYALNAAFTALDTLYKKLAE